MRVGSAQVLRFSGSQVLRFSGSQVLRFSGSLALLAPPSLGFSGSTGTVRFPPCLPQALPSLPQSLRFHLPLSLPPTLARRRSGTVHGRTPYRLSPSGGT